ncbi:MAG: type IX secretion system membrane protein PorP/SprF [Vicingaceae bacterium]
MKKTTLLILLFGLGQLLFAQQLPQYSQYLLNRYVINPASAGVENHFIGQTNYRSQWEGVQDAPRTYIMSVNGPLKHEKMGIGGYIFTDITGPTRRNGISFSYSYHLQLNNEINLSMAINGGLLQYSIDGSEITFENEADQLRTTLQERNLFPDAGFSFYLYADNYYFGASAPQLIQNELDFEGSLADPAGRLVNHYFITGGYAYALNNNFDLEPNLMLKYVKPLPLQYELTLRGIYQKKTWLGFSYRQNDAFVLMAGYTLQGNLSLGYSYDIIQSDIQNYSSGTHEIMLSIKFNDKESQKPE